MGDDERAKGIARFPRGRLQRSAQLEVEHDELKAIMSELGLVKQ